MWGFQKKMLALASLATVAAEPDYPLLSDDQSTFLLFMAAITFFLPVGAFALRGGF